jgi:hypothetical protein
MVDQLYTPPPDTYDQPFTWVWNEPSGTVPGQNLLNQQITMDQRVGDFVLRRVAGISAVLKPGVGQFQLRDYQGAVIESEPAYVSPLSDELPICPELFYPQTGQIRFDFYNIR